MQHKTADKSRDACVLRFLCDHNSASSFCLSTSSLRHSTSYWV